MVYAVRFGSELAPAGIIWGSSNDSQMEGDRGVHIMPEVCRTMKDICWGVIVEALMIRSPSFSRSGESRTTRNSPRLKADIQDSMGSKSVEDIVLSV